MATPILHINGRAKRAQNLVQVPMYFVYSSQNPSDATTTLVVDSTLFLGARKASNQVLVQLDNAAVANYQLVGGNKYVPEPNIGNLATITSKGIHQLLLEGYLDTQVITSGQVINSIFVVSYVSGFSPASKEILSASEIQAAVFVVEIVHALSASGGSITTSGAAKKLQIVLEV
jgi:hypothetical protein